MSFSVFIICEAKYVKIMNNYNLGNNHKFYNYEVVVISFQFHFHPLTNKKGQNKKYIWRTVGSSKLGFICLCYCVGRRYLESRIWKGEYNVALTPKKIFINKCENVALFVAVLVIFGVFGCVCLLPTCPQRIIKILCNNGSLPSQCRNQNSSMFQKV